VKANRMQTEVQYPIKLLVKANCKQVGVIKLTGP